MAENLGKRPSKGILKNSSSFDSQEAPSRAQKETKWDEMNIIATLHPAEKDYGHMKIEEPKTPYNYEGVDEEEEDQLDASVLASKLAKSSPPKIFDEYEDEDEDEEETPEERARRKAFEAKRKGHYREWEAVQLARQKLLEDEDDDDDEDHAEQEDEHAHADNDDEACDEEVTADAAECAPSRTFVASSSNDSSSQ